jgi:3',5'-cyclic AMP phosphodiesterase CpdA
LIAQICDLHVTPPGTLAYGCVDTAAALTGAIDTLNRLAPRRNLVVISGDIVHSALPEEYAHATKLLCARCRFHLRPSREIMTADYLSATPSQSQPTEPRTVHSIRYGTSAGSMSC